MEINQAIVCVDDQREVLAALLKDLSELSGAYDIIDCESVSEALGVLEELKKEGISVAMVMTDYVMPGQSGLELIDILCDSVDYKDVPKVLLAGYADHESLIEAKKDKLDLYLSKPWNSENLLTKVKSLFN